MNKSFLLLLPILVAMSISGCKKSNNSLHDGNLHLSAKMQTQGDVSTKSILLGEDFEDGTTIGIFLSGTDYDSRENIFSDENDIWCGDPVTLNENKATIYGFYPTEEPESEASIVPSTEDKTIPVNISNPEDFNGNNQADYMYALSSVENKTPYYLASVDKENNIASLVFLHALSRITLSVKLDENFRGTASLTEIKLRKPIDKKDFYYKDGTMSLEASPAKRFSLKNTTNELTFSGIHALSTVASNINVLVVPTNAENITISMIIVINGSSYTSSGVMPLGTGTSSFTEWKASNNYIYNITVNGSELIIKNPIDIIGWDDISGGDMEVN
jgi:hypothetical protein